MLLPTSTTLSGTPAAAMNELARAIEQRPGVIDCTVFHGFPYVDVPQVGVHVVVTTDDDPALAEACADEVAAWIWEHRQRFRNESHSPHSALLAARGLVAAGTHPVVINETSDNPGGGAPGDGTHLLRAMLDAGIEHAAFGFIADPDVAEAAHRAGVGARLDVRLGGKHGARSRLDRTFQHVAPQGGVPSADLDRADPVEAGDTGTELVERADVGGVESHPQHRTGHEDRRPVGRDRVERIP